MDPTEAELNAITTLGDIADWAGTTGGLHDTLVASLGTPTKLRDIAFISRQTWDRVVGGLQLEVTPATDDAAAVTRPLNPTEESRVEIFRRVCLKRLGITHRMLQVVPAYPRSWLWYQQVLEVLLRPQHRWELHPLESSN